MELLLWIALLKRIPILQYTWFPEELKDVCSLGIRALKVAQFIVMEDLFRTVFSLRISQRSMEVQYTSEEI